MSITAANVQGVIPCSQCCVRYNRSYYITIIVPYYIVLYVCVCSVRPTVSALKSAEAVLEGSRRDPLAVSTAQCAVDGFKNVQQTGRRCLVTSCACDSKRILKSYSGGLHGPFIIRELPNF